MSDGATGRKVINSVQRAADILGLFAVHGNELGTTEIAGLLGLHKSTAAGLIYTLEATGLLEQDPATRKYRLGFRLVELATVVLDRLDVRQLARGPMDDLRRAAGETVNLGIRDGRDVVYVERLAGTHSLAMRREVGSRTPLHASALGKVLVAWLPDAERERVLAEQEYGALTPRSAASANAFRAELARTRERGYAIDDEENEVGGRCVAAPIADHTGRIIAAVSVSAPAQRMPHAKLEQLGDDVRHTASKISRQLGHRPS